MQDARKEGKGSPECLGPHLVFSQITNLIRETEACETHFTLLLSRLAATMTGSFLIHLLLEHGANVNLKNRKGQTPLSLVLPGSRQHPDQETSQIIRMLKSAGAKK